MAIVGLPGLYLVASSASCDWVWEMLPEDDLMAPMSPAFIAQLSAKIGRSDDGVDVLLAAPGLGGRSGLIEVDPHDHARIVRALEHRDEVRVFTDVHHEAVVILGRGLGRRLEVAVEVLPSVRDRGLASQALREARHLIAPDDVLFAQSAVANAASIRALIHAGFVPIGAEVLFFSGPRATS